MKKILVVCSGVIAMATALAALAHPAKTHRLEATPATVAYGYYWSDAPPVLRIESGDIIVAFGTRNIAGIDELHRLLTAEVANQSTALTILRGVELRKLPITPLSKEN